ncbi:MAG: glycosyltransferase family 2 protein [Paludibacteraceae bacterium]|nr:glycosyltransferase family 2 protein [Paludibacteraceae bacterium]
MKKLQILIPQYKETEDIIKPLLDSIEVQQNVDLKNDVGVIIVNDGTDVHLSQELFDRYSFDIEYYLNEHKGVSATRNACLDHATAEYVMFCDADDMFYNACGMYIIFREIENGGFDSLVSAFIEESRIPETKEVVYINHDMDSTFVHGKVHNRQYLIDNNIRWNDNLTIHEDSYFNCLCQRLASELKYSQTSFYLWRWRDASVCRHDPKYILKTYNNMLDSNDALIEQFLRRRKTEDAQFFAVNMIYDAYFTMNKDEWLSQENQEYRLATEKRFKEYWLKYKKLHDSIPQDVKAQIIMGIKNRMYAEGMVLETLTFNEWIKQVEGL